jgi:hypothetical protein
MRSSSIPARRLPFRRIVALPALIVVGALAAAGAAASTPGGAPLPLEARVMHLSDMRLYPHMPKPGKQGTTRDPATWSKESGLTKAQLGRDGFVVGIEEELGPTLRGAFGVSMAAQFKSPTGAAMAARQGVVTSTNHLHLPEIPRARGYKVYNGHEQAFEYYISFSDGDFAYVEVFVEPSDVSIPRADSMVGSSVALYHRVHGHPTA